jgi:hypothetical protein
MFADFKDLVSSVDDSDSAVDLFFFLAWVELLH